MTEEIKAYQKKLNEAIAQIDFDKQPTALYAPLAYTLDLGGKRMRPILAIMAYLIKKSDWEKIIVPALSIELFHNFTLIHDDIMDEAPLRRGRETVYKKWNKDVAILSGDALMIMAYDLLLEAEHEDFKYIVRLFNKCAIEVCEGQQFDMDFEALPTVTEAAYIKMIRLKTAVLLGYSLELGGLLAGMTKEEAIHLRDFGVNIGIGFQLKDDILDVYGDADKFGKQVGGDIIANKKTFLLLKAIEKADGETAEKLKYWLALEDFDAQEKVTAIKEIYAQLDIHAIAETKMNHYFELGFKQLDELDADTLNLDPLKAFTQALIARDH
ncbi:polyprenyl synthetase family protein [Reichenbachiella agariperforans]|uniref:Geranylgeranyl diphosphate synthase, type II n=1 Tax=Reichenbachiella agariperforans TaxID=156994 RepID=A0A1M6NX54_REIAG|nr:polyprenyl synthetase family protein [Reichenbachiella agariperforans]MBU2916078.1 polyprenyl synthetase family protein [Reichenbachiella agariperforans]SHK00327.1 geranylgeranyl diphosphate synthase, type II [Reichenbachiella agariperforans]